MNPEAFLQSPMALGIFISLACLTMYFIFPSMYYANVPRTLLIITGILGCLLVLRFSVLVGLSWGAFLLLFIYYGLNSRWYQKMVFDRTYKEWKKHLERLAEEDESREPPSEEQLLRHVAESWNPKWSDAELDRLASGCRDTGELVARVQNLQHGGPSSKKTA